MLNAPEWDATVEVSLHSEDRENAGRTVLLNGATQRKQAMFASAAEFFEVRVHALTREIRVPRVLGAFAAGRIVNPRPARTQLMGGLI